MFYNGTADEPERRTLELSDAFPGHMDRGKAALQCRAVVLNINVGHNRELMEKCRQLREYSQFIGKIREFLAQGRTLEDAVDAAVGFCVEHDILRKLLSEHRAEVCEMILFEYDEEAHIASEREIAREEGLERGRSEGLEQGLERGRSEGLERGRSEGLAQGIRRGQKRGSALTLIAMTRKKLQRGKSLEEIAEDLEEEEQALEPIYRAVSENPQRSPEEILELLPEDA